MGGKRAGRAVVSSAFFCAVLGWPAPLDAPTSPLVPPAPTEAVGTGVELVAAPVRELDAPPDVSVNAEPDRPLRSATVHFSGDVLLHSQVWRTAAAWAADADADAADADADDGYDFRPMFAPVSDWISGADWAVCHLEVNLAADNESLSSFPVFRGPGAIASDLADVGFDACSTASNHSLDGGTAATFETIGVLEAAGLRHTGTARSPRESEQSVHIEVNGIRIAHLAYTYWFNGFDLPPDQPWAANEIDEQRILADAEIARLEGADVVIVSIHWGEQYRHEPNQQQADLGPRLLASPFIDLIVGHHAHVVQPIEKIDGEWLVYGLGNFISNQTQLARRDELIVNATIREQTDGTFVVGDLEVVPVYLDLATFQVWPSSPQQRHPDTPSSIGAELDASFDRVVAVLETGSAWPELGLFGG